MHEWERKPIRNVKTKRKPRPANTLSKEDISAILDALKNHEGYPKLRDLARMVPALTPVQLNAAVRYLERTGTIVIDGDGYIIWSRNETRDSLTLGDVAVFSEEFNKFVNDR